LTALSQTVSAMVSARTVKSKLQRSNSVCSLSPSPDNDFGIVVAPTGESMPINSLNQAA
jgi:hypothetical protein